MSLQAAKADQLGRTSCKQEFFIIKFFIIKSLDLLVTTNLKNNQNQPKVKPGPQKKRKKKIHLLSRSCTIKMRPDAAAHVRHEWWGSVFFAAKAAEQPITLDKTSVCPTALSLQTLIHLWMNDF